MDVLDKTLERLYAPLRFASDNDFARFSLVKNVGPVITALSLQLQSEIKRVSPEPHRRALLTLSQHLSRLFGQYDSLSENEKKGRITEAIRLVLEIKEHLLLISDSRQYGKKCKGLIGDTQEIQPFSIAVRVARGIGPRLAERLSEKGIFTIEDLLYFLPRDYQDRREVQPLTDVVLGAIQTVVGRIRRVAMNGFGRRRIFEVTIDDGQGTLKAKWLHGREAYLKEAFQLGRRLILTGKVGGSPFGKEMVHPDFEFIDDHEDQSLHFRRIVPVYSVTEGIAQKTLRRIIWQTVRDYGDAVSSPIPDEILRHRHLPDIRRAVHQVHFPSDDQDIGLYLSAASDAHRRLIYDELFFFQLALALTKQIHHRGPAIVFPQTMATIERFLSLLPFSLTDAQRRVITEIVRDMGMPRRMHRLLQGDVGSGKTIVSMAAMLLACSHGYQSVLMAPTEILAEQHYKTLKKWSSLVGLHVGLFTGKGTIQVRNEKLAELKSGAIDIAVGTHALIQKQVTFSRLGLVVIDEQHRFGVQQRSALRDKGLCADLLVMTATPIPRTLAMTVYGDLDISLIDEIPPNRLPVQTKVLSDRQRKQLYESIREEVRLCHQIFMVYPIIEASEKVDLRDATRMAVHLQEEVFPDCRIGLIHGRMKRNEKGKIMEAFGRGEIDILVATTLIEVGIDVPSASMIVIEHAERFGLSELHQLRGRVGRGDIPSVCILMTHCKPSDIALERLKVLEDTNDGFRVAEADLAIRGPGEFMGVRQSGLPNFRIADIRRDAKLLFEARRDAFFLIDNDPSLSKAEHRVIRDETYRRWATKMAFSQAE